ncbi:unnamed protein product [Linum trigynum]|uniref:Cysteine proteinase inhibitor n=1 Tax=Linum trigynum TaxID=586398 RepID=A0AAV2E5D4_9ROSI
MKAQITLAVVSILAALSAAGATTGWQPVNDLTSGGSVREVADFAVATHNHWVPLHQLRLVQVDTAELKVVVPNVNAVYQLVLTTVDGGVGGVGTQQFKAVVGVVTLRSGQNVKTLLSFLPKLI